MFCLKNTIIIIVENKVYIITTNNFLMGDCDLGTYAVNKRLN